jgi:hypothetical protein
MNAKLTETDAINRAEAVASSQSTAPRLALFFYRDRLAEGYPGTCAYAMALAYLRRKTGLSIPLAQAALDELL